MFWHLSRIRSNPISGLHQVDIRDFDLAQDGSTRLNEFGINNLVLINCAGINYNSFAIQVGHG